MARLRSSGDHQGRGSAVGLIAKSVGLGLLIDCRAPVGKTKRKADRLASSRHEAAPESCNAYYVTGNCRQFILDPCPTRYG